jgi:SAM-dependent MidA family methyltransferase
MSSGFRPWRDAWAEALYGVHGFYRRTEGPRGHFETSANAPGGVTGLLAEALLELARRHGCHRVVDLGAGRGELLHTLAGGAQELELLGVDVVRRPADLPPSVGWVLSPGGAELPSELVDLEAALVVAHEWLDVVPCDVLELDGAGQLREVEVDGAGTERLGPRATAELEDWCARWWPVAGLAPGVRVEVGLTRDRAWADLLARVRSGVVLAVDYGHVATGRPPRGSLAGHRSGRLVPPRPDGSCDLTAEVAWDSLIGSRTPTRQRGVISDGRLPQSSELGPELVSQRAALRALGVDGARPAPAGDTAAYLRDLQRAGAAATLLDRGGLGGLSWLIQPVAIGQPEPPPARLEP